MPLSGHIHHLHGNIQSCPVMAVSARVYFFTLARQTEVIKVQTLQLEAPERSLS
jgi:hypothetical protein